MDSEVRVKVFGSHMDTESSHFEQFRCKYGEVYDCEYDTGYYNIYCELLGDECVHDRCPRDFQLTITSEDKAT